MFTKTQKKIFFSCFLLYTCAYITRLNLSAALPAIRDTLSLTEAQTGLIQTLFAVTYAAGQLVNGILSDRMRPRTLMVYGILASSAINLLMGVTANYPMLLILWSLNGAAQSMLWTPIVRLISVYFHGDDRNKVSTGLSLTIVIGHFVAWAISGFMAKLFHWRFSFIIPAVIASVGAIFTNRMLAFDNTGKAEKTGSAGKETKDRIPVREMLGTGLIFMLVAGICNGFVRDSIMTWAPSIIRDTANSEIGSLDTAITLLIPVLNAIGIIFGRLCSNALKGKTRVSIGALTAIGGLFALALYLLTGCGVVVCALLLGACCAMMYGINPLITTMFPMEYDSLKCVGLVAGLIDCFIYIGSALSGVMIGWLHDTFQSWNAIYLAWVGVLVLNTLLSFLSVRGGKKLSWNDR